MGILMGNKIRVLMGILIGIFMGILMMDSMGWPYDSSDCLLSSSKASLCIQNLLGFGQFTKYFSFYFMLIVQVLCHGWNCRLLESNSLCIYISIFSFFLNSIQLVAVFTSNIELTLAFLLHFSANLSINLCLLSLNVSI